MVEYTSRNLKPIPTNMDFVSKGRNIVTVIGIDNYVNWPKLHNAVNDAIGIQKLFVEKLGFISPRPPLLNSDATQKNLTSLVQEQLHEVLEPDDSLIIFFAGHGHTRLHQIPGKTTETGYIIPVEAQIDHWSDYIKIDSFLEDISNLPARHILVILDACHSGFALGNAMKTFRDAVSYEQDLINYVSRKIITSARRNEAALDGGPVEGHSLFTGTLVDGLNWGKADMDANGFVTSSELGLFLQQRVGQASESKQTPDFGSFHLDDRGEMVISLRDDTFDAIKARAFTALQKGDRAQFEELVGKVVDLRPQSPEALYLQYRLYLSKNDIDSATRMVRQLKTLDLSKGTVPLSIHDLETLEVQLFYWRPVMLIPEEDFPLEVTILTGPDEENLTKASLIPEDGREVYLVENRAVVRIKVKNLTQDLAHLYYFAITQAGRLLIGGPLLEDDESRFNGLIPGIAGQSRPCLIKGSPGLTEIRLFYSSRRVSRLLSPDIVPTRCLSTFYDEHIDKIKMKSIWCRNIEKNVII